MFLEQFSDEGARYDDAFVDVEALLAEPGFIGQVGSRQALFAAAAENFQQGFALMRQQAGVEEGFEAVERQVERVQGEIDVYKRQCGDSRI